MNVSSGSPPFFRFAGLAVFMLLLHDLNVNRIACQHVPLSGLCGCPLRYMDDDKMIFAYAVPVRFDVVALHGNPPPFEASLICYGRARVAAAAKWRWRSAYYVVLWIDMAMTG